MKNPFKALGAKLKELGGKLKPKPEDRGVFKKEALDGLGDGGLVGGFMLLGAAFIVPGAGIGAAAVGIALVAGGTVAKYGASRLKTGVPPVTDPSVAVPDIDAPAPLKKVSPDFKVSSEPKVSATVRPPAARPPAPPAFQ